MEADSGGEGFTVESKFDAYVRRADLSNISYCEEEEAPAVIQIISYCIHAHLLCDTSKDEDDKDMKVDPPYSSI